MNAEVVAFPEERRRVANVTGVESCRTCGDEAMVVVDDGAVPCPFCERGFGLEFGIGRDANGVEYERTDGGPWGKSGFWRGRPIPEGLRA